VGTFKRVLSLSHCHRERERYSIGMFGEVLGGENDILGNAQGGEI